MMKPPRRARDARRGHRSARSSPRCATTVAFLTFPSPARPAARSASGDGRRHDAPNRVLFVLSFRQHDAPDRVLFVLSLIATEDCVLGLPEIAFGLVPDVGGTTRLVRAVGEPRARELILTGRLVRARTAERYGLVHEVVADAGALDAAVRALAERLTAHAPAALGLAKTLCQLSVDADSASSFRLEGVVQQVLLGQPDLAARFQAAVAFIKAQYASAT